MSTSQFSMSDSSTDNPPLENFYQRMSLIRAVEERISEIYPTDKVKSPVHLSIGQEAPSVGVCEALSPDDTVFGTYRGHALYLAKGGDLNAMIAELFGKIDGCGKGKAGSMHLVAPEVHMMGTSAVVATSIPQAAGYALAEKMKGNKSVTTVFFGDGAMEEGVFHETMNFAALHKLPMIFVCENNGYAIFTPLETRVANLDFGQRAQSYGIENQKIENNDVIETYRVVSDVAARIRTSGEGPCFIEIETQRWYEHVGPNEDWQRGYRDPALRELWIESDQIKRIASMIDDETRKRIDATNANAIETAFSYAEQSPYPGHEELLQDVYYD